MSAYERFPVAAASETVVAALREILRERGFAEYAVVDYGRDMAAAGQPRFVAWTLIFGNPAAGATRADRSADRRASQHVRELAASLFDNGVDGDE